MGFRKPQRVQRLVDDHRRDTLPVERPRRPQRIAADPYDTAARCGDRQCSVETKSVARIVDEHEHGEIASRARSERAEPVAQIVRREGGEVVKHLSAARGLEPRGGGDDATTRQDVRPQCSPTFAPSTIEACAVMSL